MTRSLRHRLYRRHESRYVWGVEPIISPNAERLKRAPVGDHVCRSYAVTIMEDR